MIIRSEQIDAYAVRANKQFEDKAVAHASQFAPKHTEVLTEPGTRSVVRFGIERAMKYGFSATGPVHLFLELMFVLGSEFDTDPQYRWAADVLTDKTIPGEMPRADALFARSMIYLDAVAGPNNEFAISALRRVKALPGSLPIAKTDFIAEITALLTATYPQKANYLGEHWVRDLVLRGSARAKAAGFSTNEAALLFSALEFSLGHAFDRDPLYPWIGSTLRETKISNRDEIPLRLTRKTMTYLDHTLVYLEQMHHGKV